MAISHFAVHSALLSHRSSVIKLGDIAWGIFVCRREFTYKVYEEANFKGHLGRNKEAPLI